jgi:hypothetical protein
MKTPKSLKSAMLITVTAAATALLMQACGGGAIAQTAVAEDIDPIEGAWDGTVTSKDCTSGAVAGSFRVLHLYHRGGTVDIDNAQGRSGRGNIYGVWQRATSTAYKVNVIHQRFNPDSTFAGTNKIKRTLTLGPDGNSFTATLAIQFLDPAGVVLTQACATESAARVTF